MQMIAVSPNYLFLGLPHPGIAGLVTVGVELSAGDQAVGKSRHF